MSIHQIKPLAITSLSGTSLSGIQAQVAEMQHELERLLCDLAELNHPHPRVVMAGNDLHAALARLGDACMSLHSLSRVE